jgi:chloride channel protein, CIC family
MAAILTGRGCRFERSTALHRAADGAALGVAGLQCLAASGRHGQWPMAPRTRPSGRGFMTGLGQIAPSGLSSRNGIDINAAIWFSAGRMPTLPRRAAPLAVASGAGAGMSAAYGVPLGGALIALEVLRGMLALRLVLPALAASICTVLVSWLAIPDAPLYVVPPYHFSSAILAWALLLGPLAGVISVVYVRAMSWADRHRPTGWRRVATPNRHGRFGCCLHSHQAANA